MADTNTQKDNIAELRAELSNLLKSMEGKSGDLTADITDKLSSHIEHCRGIAAAKAQQICEMGQAGMGEVEEHVRRNPLSSILIAFGAGCVISCIARHLFR